MDKIRLCLQVHCSTYLFANNINIRSEGSLVELFLENVFKIALKLAKTGRKIIWNPFF